MAASLSLAARTSACAFCIIASGVGAVAAGFGIGGAFCTLWLDANAPDAFVPSIVDDAASAIQ
jgi:hypothetical protein